MHESTASIHDTQHIANYATVWQAAKPHNISAVAADTQSQTVSSHLCSLARQMPIILSPPPPIVDIKLSHYKPRLAVEQRHQLTIDHTTPV